MALRVFGARGALCDFPSERALGFLASFFFFFSSSGRIGRDAICDAVRGDVGATCFPLTEASRCTEKVVVVACLLHYSL